MTMITTEPNTETTLAQGKNYLAQTYARAPFVITHGEGMTVWDSTGKSYLDFVAGIAVMALGHSDPGVVQVMQEQAATLMHVSNLYYTPPQIQLAVQLCEASFADKVFFCNSGAEANEACIKFARKYARANGHQDKTEIIGFSHAFHGRTIGVLSVTPKPQYQDAFQPLMPGVHILPYNDIEAAQAAIGPHTCAVMIEPIQGEGGIHAATPKFLQTLRDLCDQYDALLIFDEVQCGLGRTGDLWAHTASGVTPDLMSLAKPLAAGLPIGAALMTDKVNAALAPGDHGSTFAGGSVVCAVASYALSRINTPEMLGHVQETGEYLMERLAELNSPHILDVRGRGLMIGMELDFPAAEVIQAGYDAGFLLVNAGPNVIRFVPPLIVEKQHIDALITFLSSFLASK
ncbi:MAG: acetylornithine aminotransferase [Chloroflexota bacterium]|nr:MAG: acetylornithine aminotransferase [Chloroflexota bacterium]